MTIGFVRCHTAFEPCFVEDKQDFNIKHVCGVTVKFYSMRKIWVKFVLHFAFVCFDIVASKDY